MNTQANTHPKIFAGAVLIALGLLFLLDQTVFGAWSILDFWPLILIAIGIARIAEPWRRWSGLRLIALGALFQAITLNLFGLDWHNGWPLILVIVGVVMIGRSLTGEEHRCALRPGESNGP